MSDTESGGIERWANDVHQGDAVETLRQLPESSVHMAMCSPPYYGLRDYGVDGQIGLEESLAEYVASIVEVADELHRVLRPDGSWWLNIGDTFSGSQNGRSMEGETKESQPPEGRPSPGETTLRRKSKMLVPHRVAIALQEAGWVVRSDAVWAKPNPMPNPVKDRLHEHKEFLFHLTPAPDYWFDLDAIREPHKDASLRRAEREFDDAKNHDLDRYPDRDKESRLHSFDDPLHPEGKNPGDVFEVPVKAFPDAHFAVYPPELCERPILASCPPTVCAECGTPYERRREVVEREVAGGVSPVPEDERGYDDRQGQSQNDREGLTQPTDVEVGPWEQSCGCETDATEAGIVLDPFAGAGTTCLVAKDLGRRFVGIDLNPDYVAMAQQRVGLTVDEPERLLEDDGQTTLVQADGGRNGSSLRPANGQSGGESDGV